MHSHPAAAFAQVASAPLDLAELLHAQPARLAVLSRPQLIIPPLQLSSSSSVHHGLYAGSTIPNQSNQIRSTVAGQQPNQSFHQQLHLQSLHQPTVTTEPLRS